MAPGEGHQNDAVSSLHAPPQPILPIEIVEEIIIRLPVKFISQLRCVCKSWNALISDPKFARRHLRRFNRRILIVRFENSHFMSYPLPSVLNAATTGGTRLDNPLKYGNRDYSIIGSCDGIICCSNFSIELGHSFVVWNPSIRKLWELPPLENRVIVHSYGFGYDHLLDRFKLVVIWPRGYKTHFMVHTLGSNSWRRIQDSPCIPYWASRDYGKFVSGAVNWLTSDGDDGFNFGHCIISLDLGKESYQEFLQPDYGIKVYYLTMDVMRDCLCLLANWQDVWVMKEYGNNESWTKLFRLPPSNSFSKIPYYLGNLAVYVSEDYRSLLGYNYENGTFRSFDLENKPGKIKDMYVEIESLISPCPPN
ncbi:F-box/kelch-repeat protein At3g23880-like [Lotus japonicus]|uniref:F-box/kelch-repeat protein At3g23880-like n=1 Tax=Lotus japonicus TaxID=34305 RepID=UPI00258C5606|nr:F-box/kelch-repeat protein At3g23880-like [Lotus japonicus]